MLLQNTEGSIFQTWAKIDKFPLFQFFRITSVAQQWIISQISEFIFPVVTKVDQFFIFSISLNFFPWNFLGLKISHFSFFWIHFSCFSDFDILFCARSWHEPLFIHRSSLWRTSWQHRHTQRAARISLWYGLIQSFMGGAFWQLFQNFTSMMVRKNLYFDNFLKETPFPHVKILALIYLISTFNILQNQNLRPPSPKKIFQCLL